VAKHCVWDVCNTSHNSARLGWSFDTVALRFAAACEVSRFSVVPARHAGNGAKTDRRNRFQTTYLLIKIYMFSLAMNGTALYYLL